MPLWYDNFNSSCTQKAIRSCFQGWRVFPINRQRQSVIVARNDLSFSSVFCSQKHTVLGLSDIPSEILTYLHNQRYNKAIQKRLTVRITMTKPRAYTWQPFNFCNYCNILAYFHVMNNKFKATLIVLRWSVFSLLLGASTGNLSQSFIDTFSVVS